MDMSDAEVNCPLCAYNLRGLVEPRCPECGFGFRWEELRSSGASEERRELLFEVVERPRTVALVTTWWWNQWPVRLWAVMSPSDPVRVGRLARYWVAASLLTAALLVLPLPHGVIANWGQDGDPLWERCMRTWARFSDGGLAPELIGPITLAAAWPWLSAGALLVCQVIAGPMRVDWRRVVRVAVYGGDVGSVVVIAVVALLPILTTRSPGDVGVPLLFLTLLCATVTTARLTNGYAQHLRIPRPIWRVLASQALVVGVVTLVLARTTDLTKLFL